MDRFILIVGIVLLVLMIAVLYRMIVGPTSVDRMIAVNIIGTKTTIVLLVIGALNHRLEMYVDLALAYALLNFIASLAAARMIRRRKTADPWNIVKEVIE